MFAVVELFDQLKEDGVVPPLVVNVIIPSSSPLQLASVGVVAAERTDGSGTIAFVVSTQPLVSVIET